LHLQNGELIALSGSAAESYCGHLLRQSCAQRDFETRNTFVGVESTHVFGSIASPSLAGDLEDMRRASVAQQTRRPRQREVRSIVAAWPPFDICAAMIDETKGLCLPKV